MPTPRELHEIRTLKAEGHDLIDAIARTGISKNGAYFLLKQKIDAVAGGEHFSNMYTKREVTRAITCLEAILNDRLLIVERRRATKRQAIAEKRLQDKLEREKLNPHTPRPQSKKGIARKQNTLPLVQQREAIAKLRTAEKKKPPVRLWDKVRIYVGTQWEKARPNGVE